MKIYNYDILVDFILIIVAMTTQSSIFKNIKSFLVA